MIENIHTIIAAAAVKFSFDQLTHLFVLIQKVVSHSGGRYTDQICVDMLTEVCCCVLELGG